MIIADNIKKQNYSTCPRKVLINKIKHNYVHYSMANHLMVCVEFVHVIALILHNNGLLCVRYIDSLTTIGVL